MRTGKPHRKSCLCDHGDRVSDHLVSTRLLLRPRGVSGASFAPRVRLAGCDLVRGLPGVGLDAGPAPRRSTRPCADRQPAGKPLDSRLAAPPRASSAVDRKELRPSSVRHGMCKRTEFPCLRCGLGQGAGLDAPARMKARHASGGIRTTGLGRVQSSVVSAEKFAPVPDFTPRVVVNVAAEALDRTATGP